MRTAVRVSLLVTLSPNCGFNSRRQDRRSKGDALRTRAAKVIGHERFSAPRAELKRRILRLFNAGVVVAVRRSRTERDRSPAVNKSPNNAKH